MKKILVINYSQTGQLDEIISNFIAPLEECEIDRVKLHLRKEYEFPWSNDVFFNEMPETVLEKGVEILPVEYKYDSYDLIIFGYAPWFLSPSPPCVALLKDEKFKLLLKDTPVVTLIGCRNMWLNSQESVKKYIEEAGGKLVGNVVLYDRNSNLISAFTILYWMQSGKKERLYNLFPKPGIADEDIQGSGRFGNVLNEALKSNDLDSLQNKILDLGLIKISTNIMFVELRGKILFKLWAKKIASIKDKPKKRLRWIRIFKYYLLIALFIISPLVLIVYNILALPFVYARVKTKKMYFYQLKLKD